MIKCSVVCWIAIALFLGLTFTLPAPYRHFLWIPYAILLPLGITVGNRGQSKIQQIESQNKSSDATGD